MVNLLSRVIGVFLSFAMCIVGPALILGCTNDLTMNRAVQNEMRNFVDKVTDTGSITDKELADFYLACSGYGVAMDVNVERLAKIVSPDGKGGTLTSQTLTPNNKTYNKGDIIRVHVKAIDYTGIQKFTWSLTHFYVVKFDSTLAGRVRQ